VQIAQPVFLQLHETFVGDVFEFLAHRVASQVVFLDCLAKVLLGPFVRLLQLLIIQVSDVKLSSVGEVSLIRLEALDVLEHFDEQLFVGDVVRKELEAERFPVAVHVEVNLR